jgi:hypothetical protein
MLEQFPVHTGTGRIDKQSFSHRRTLGECDTGQLLSDVGNKHGCSVSVWTAHAISNPVIGTHLEWLHWFGVGSRLAQMHEFAKL